MYVPVFGAVSCPVQRALKLSAPIPDIGAAVPHEKFTVGSARVIAAPLNVVLAKYAPAQPEPAGGAAAGVVTVAVLAGPILPAASTAVTEYV